MAPSSYSEYSDDESVDVRVRHVSVGPGIRRLTQQPQYVQTVRERDMVRERDSRPIYQAGPMMLKPDRTTVIHTRSRSRSRERRSSPPRQPPPVPSAPPVVINNRIINEHDHDHDHDHDQSDSDDYSYSDVSHRHRRRRSRSRSRSQSRSRSRVHKPSRNSSAHSHLEDMRDKWELEKARQELEDLRLSNARKTDEERMEEKFREDAKLQRAKHELEEIKQRQEKEKTEKRIRKEIEIQRLEEERRETEERERRDREAKEAVERYKLKEKEREEAERLKKEAFDKEYQRRLREDLVRSGLDDKAIEAILKKEKIKKEEKKEEKKAEKKEEGKKSAVEQPQPGPRPTYTRMSLRHLEVQTLIEHKVEFDYDREQPGYVIIKRWVPEWEQAQLWEHTRRIRLIGKKQENVMLAVDRRRKDDGSFEWVRKKERHRSKSPSLLMYLAGARPA